VRGRHANRRENDDQKEAQRMNHPNILYIHTHDCGRWVQPYGFNVPTPNIQRLAEGGTLFRRMHCAAPTCSPSRAAMLTGMNAHSSGMTGLAHRGFSLNNYDQHLIHTLGDAGYYSALSGTQHVASDSTVIGYDEILEDGSIEEKAARFLSNPPSQPFFLSVGFGVTHRAYPEPEEQEDERYVIPPPIFPDTPETRHDFATYQAAARILDDQMGHVFSALEKNTAARNTIVVCTTDHGIAWPGMKCTLRDHGIGVMFIMKGPGIEAGHVSDALLSQIDLFPTLCDMIGIDRPDWLEGNSFLPIIDGEQDEVNDEIFADVTFHAAYEPQRCIRTNRWKYIRRWGPVEHPVMSNCDASLTKDLWMKHGWKGQHTPREELYDLVFDPQEVNNVADRPENTEVMDDLRARLDSWMERTDDPMLSGNADPPKGAQITDAESDVASGPIIQY
jgi:N-sulfoglucosamine sulfohydrolase